MKGEFALKRVPHINRHEQFRREVEAIKRSQIIHAAHPNIISLIDHSALDETAETDKQFLAMPIAQGGDLSAPGRLALYKNSIGLRGRNHPPRCEAQEHSVYGQWPRSLA